MNTLFPALPPSAFAPAPRDADSDALARPSLSYWQDAWRRLRRNRRALASIGILAFLGLFTLLGPLVWRQDPAQQDLTQISQPPAWPKTALVVAPQTPFTPPPLPAATPPHTQTNTLSIPWGPTTPPSARGLSESREYGNGVAIDGGGATTTEINSLELKQPQNLRLLEPPTTQRVRLAWDPIPGAEAYNIYRSHRKPQSFNDLGLPLGESPAHQPSYEDRLNLQPRDYHYSIVPTDGLDEYETFAAIKATPALVITQAEALAKGLAPQGQPPRIGAELTLAFHPFGTDYLGRDLLARVMAGAQVSLFIGLVAPLIFVLLGVIYGGVAGYFGGLTDSLLMRFADFIVALPFILFMILFRIAFGIGPGESGIFPMLIALVLLGWPATARLVRGQVLQLREQGYIQAARLMGGSDSYLILRHILPGALGVILVTLTFAVPTAIFTEAFLSFIGIGVAPPTPSWGSLCNEGVKTMLSHPHELIFPALFISVTVLAFNLLGDGLTEALDARQRGRE